MKFKVGKTYVVTETFITPTVTGHEVGGSWDGGRVVELDPGNKFTIVERQKSSPNGLSDKKHTGWFVAKMNHKLWFESQENPGGKFSWEGQLYVRNDAHGKNVKEKE